MKRLFLNSPALLIGAFTVSWAVIELLGPMASVSVYQMLWIRYAIHLAFLAVVFGPRQRFGLVRSPHLPRQIFRSLLMLGTPLGFLWSVERMSLHDALAIFWTAPLWIIAIAAVTRAQSGGIRTIVTAVIGLVGAILICQPDAGIFRPASIFALGMAVCFALYLVVSRTMRHEPELTKLFHTGLWVFVSLSFFLPLFWQMPTLRGFAAISGIGLIGCGALYILDRATELISPAFVAPVLYLQLAWEVLIQWFSHGLSYAALPDTKTLAGTVLVFVAAAPAFLWHARQTRFVTSPSMSSEIAGEIPGVSA